MNVSRRDKSRGSRFDRCDTTLNFLIPRRVNLGIGVVGQ